MKKIIQSIALIGCIAVLALLFFRVLVDRTDENTSVEVDSVAKGNIGAAVSPALAWELPRVGGDRLGSTDLLGKIVVIDFWATWCAPCRAEIPGYVELQEEFNDRGVVFVGVSLDQGAKAGAAVRKFIEDYNINYPIVMADANIAETFGGIAAVPTTFILDREGRIVQRKVGYRPKSFVEGLLRRITNRSGGENYLRDE